MKPVNKSLVALSAIIAFFTGARGASALQPPREGELTELAAQGKLAERQAFAVALGNNRFHPALVEGMMKRLGGPSAQMGPGYLLRKASLPATGSPKVLVLLIEFPDYPRSNDRSLVDSRIFGDGDPAHFPRESLTNYYERSSYGQLHIEGTVLPWYMAQNNRHLYTTNMEGLIVEALNSFDSTHDFSQYDGDGDGEIEYFCVCWTGPPGAWASEWWASFRQFSNGAYTLDGKRLGGYSWQEEIGAPGGMFHPKVLIHETGHALGLADYYDYDRDVGPDGGVGGIDTMDAKNNDHCCLSKFLLGWIEPRVLSSSADNGTLTLRYSAENPDAAIILPAFPWPYAEFFMVQNRSRGKHDNDFDFPHSWEDDYPGNGLVIWHVDMTTTVTPQGDTVFLYDNSYTDHKFLRLVQADGRDHIELQSGIAESNDFFWSPEYTEFTGSTNPASTRYSGAQTDISITEISAPGDTMTANVQFPVYEIVGLSERRFVAYLVLLLLAIGIAAIGKARTTSSRSD
ncbi:M6 family metalloprotease domain-containing protein [Candidatus Hydrogenedentota bacterium]